MTELAATEIFAETETPSKKKIKDQSAPNVLSFQRAALFTDALMYADMDGKQVPVEVIRHGIRGTQNVNENSTVERNVANIQTTDSAILPAGAKALLVKFDFRFLPLDESILTSVSYAEDPGRELANKYRNDLFDYLSRARAGQGAEEIARRYARNILNGRWLWRNRTIGQRITITASAPAIGFTISADTLSLPFNHFNDYTYAEIELGAALVQGLRKETSAVFSIEARVEMGCTNSVEVYPSQMYVESKPKGLSRILAVAGHAQAWQGTATDLLEYKGVRVMGTAKLGAAKVQNALRTIDTWYPEYPLFDKPIAIEATGANLETQYVFRPAKNKDGSTGKNAFYLCTRLKELDPDSEEGMYMTACLIRAGVYSK